MCVDNLSIFTRRHLKFSFVTCKIIWNWWNWIYGSYIILQSLDCFDFEKPQWLLSSGCPYAIIMVVELILTKLSIRNKDLDCPSFCYHCKCFVLIGVMQTTTQICWEGSICLFLFPKQNLKSEMNQFSLYLEEWHEQ